MGKNVRRSEDKSLYKHVYYGDIVFNMMRAWQGAIGVVKNEGMVSPAYISAVPNESIFPKFMDYCLRRKDVIGQINNLSYGVTDFRKRLYWDAFSRVVIAFPTILEQKRITESFHNLDNLITLHQCKYRSRRKKVRYAWEQRKLGDVFKEYSEKNHAELPALTIIQGGGTIKREESDRNLMYDESHLSNYKMVRKDDFIVHLRSFEGGLEKSLLDGIISPAYHTFHSDEADSRFYYPYFRSHEFIKHKLVPHVYGIRDGRSIDIDGMKTIEIPYTSTEEQRKIGDYLESLDHLITLHQRKLFYRKKCIKSYKIIRIEKWGKKLCQN